MINEELFLRLLNFAAAIIGAILGLRVGWDMLKGKKKKKTNKSSEFSQEKKKGN